MAKTPIDKQVAEMLRGVAEILPTEEDLAARLKKKGKLRIKLGIDPTHMDLTLGHTVVLEKLRTFQDLGHQVIYIIGDFTALVGDPSGRKKARPQLTEEQIREYAATFREQAGKILDMDKAEVRYNSEWLAKLSMKDCVELCSQMTVARMLEREDFGARYRSETPIYIHEFLYALLQAYDSVAVKPDIEIGATEQKFNLLMGRQLMQHFGMEPQMVLTMPILVGTDGVMKMSKSEGNYIALTDTPQDMFGKVMSIPDGIITHYFRLLTQKTEPDIAAMEKAMAEGANPMDFKRLLAEEITKKFHGGEHGEEIGKQERERFIAAFSEAADEETYFVRFVRRILEGADQQDTSEETRAIRGLVLEYRSNADWAASALADFERLIRGEPTSRKSSHLDMFRELLVGRRGTPDENRRLVEEFGRLLSEKAHIAQDCEVKQPARQTPLRMSILDLIVETGAVKSRNDARRLLEQGAIRFNGATMADQNQQVSIVGGEILEVGKKRAFQLRLRRRRRSAQRIPEE